MSDKVSKAHLIRNYPGLPEIPGDELARHLLEHLQKMEIPVTDKKAAMIYAMGDYFSLQIDETFVEAKTVILATGVSFGKPLPGEDENLGRGVSYCATCDAALYRGKEAVVATPLRPAGFVDVGGQRLSAASSGDFLEKGVRVQITGAEGDHLVVRPL